MARIKAGVQTRRRHKSILKQAKGFRGARSRHFKAAKEGVMRALAYSYRGRKERKRDFRRLWILRISAAAKLFGLKYSELIHALKEAKIELNRKSLADMAVNDREGFAKLIEIARATLGKSAETRDGAEK